MKAPGLGQSQQSILHAVKRRGSMTIPQLAAELDLNIETIRDHLRALERHQLVRREGSRSSGPGRPEIVYTLTPEAGALFPRREGEILQDLALYLEQTGHERILPKFFEHRIGGRREAAMARVRHLKGRERLKEVARILSELGFMAVVEGSVRAPTLRLCHCPIRQLVDVTKVPCRAEVGFITELLGERLTRLSYIPAGGTSCSYRAEPKC
ncbi:MAG: helix-turn-helix domain-containing protein [Gemmatimonadota bacterium]